MANVLLLCVLPLALASCTRSEAQSVRNETSRGQLMSARDPLPVEGQLPELDATEWINSRRLTPSSLRGKVVLVEFWTYSCINWRRQLPYVRAWWNEYRTKGLVVLGVHSPEFEFEQDLANVRRAVQDLGVGFPVAVDSDLAIWTAFDNQYWPALYFVDAQGRIRHHQFGEGEYTRSEEVLQQLLIEAGGEGIARNPVSVVGSGAEAAADWSNLGSSETYLGYERAENFAWTAGATRERRESYSAPPSLSVNQWALSGEWTIARQSVVLHQPVGRIHMRFHARDLHLVMGAASRGASVEFRVRLDGNAPADAHGVDVDELGKGTLSAPRMFHLIRQQPPILDRDFEIEFLGPGVEAFSITFG